MSFRTGSSVGRTAIISETRLPNVPSPLLAPWPADVRTDWTGKRHVGDGALNGWIGRHRPDVVLSGHIHQSPFRKGGSWVDKVGSTWVFNAGRQIGPAPTHVVIDTDARTAAWSSLAGRQEVGLDDAQPRPSPELIL